MFPAIGGAPFSPNSFKLIRLLRKGCANRPFYHIAVIEAYKNVTEPVIEQLGSYDPFPNKENEKLVAINFKRLEYWLKEGACPTPPVLKLLGLSGYFPIHYETFQDAWNNRKLIKEHLDSLRATVSEMENKKLNDLPKESTASFVDMPQTASEPKNTSEHIDPQEPVK